MPQAPTLPPIGSDVSRFIPPVGDDVTSLMGISHEPAKKPEPSTLQKIGGALTSVLPIAEGIGGAIVGAGAGAPAGPMGLALGGVAGASLGGATGESHRQLLDRWMGLPAPSTPAEAAAGIRSAGLAQAEGEVGGRGVSQVVKAVPAAVRAVLTNTNPVEAEAVKFGMSRGIPVDLATASGNKLARGVQHIADTSLGGGLLVERPAAKRTAEALTRVGEDLAGDVRPGAVSPYQAGQSVTAGVTGTRNQLATEANRAYDALRQIEAQPANTKTVRMMIPMTENGVTKMSMESVPVPMPVDLKPAQTALAPIYERMLRTMPVAQQRADPALHAIKNILDSPRYTSASLADEALGAIKGLARSEGGTASISQGLAAKAAAELGAGIDKAVQAAGPQAVAALKTGRTMTVAKHGAQRVLDELRDEPVQVFQQALWQKDAGIEKLRQVAKLAPASLPQLGRAYLDDLLSTATKDGGFERAASLARNWEQLGPQTKSLLFPKPDLVKNLDNFFLLAKKLGTNVNPSGSGTLGVQAGHLYYSALNPMTGVPLQIGGALLSSLMHNPKAVKLLTQGMVLPKAAQVPARAWSQDLGQMIAGVLNQEGEQ